MLMAFCFTSISLASECRTIQQNQGSYLSLTKLQTKYTDIPLGIDVEYPRFSWQMSASEGGHGYSQNAYRIVVTNEDGDEVWDSVTPGFKHIILQPTPDPNGIMKYARGYSDFIYGRIESGWHDQNGILHYNVTIPANTTAPLHLPALSEEEVMEYGTPASESEGVDFIGFENGEAFYKIISGNYECTVPWQTLYEDLIRINPFQLESQDD